MVERLRKGSRQRSKRTGDNTLSQIHHNGALQKGKVIALNFAEIKLWEPKQKLHSRSFPFGLSAASSNYFFNIWLELYCFDCYHLELIPNTMLTPSFWEVSFNKWVLLHTQNNDHKLKDAANQTFGCGRKLRGLSHKICPTRSSNSWGTNFNAPGEQSWCNQQLICCSNDTPTNLSGSTMWICNLSSSLILSCTCLLWGRQTHVRVCSFRANEED